MSLMLVRRDGAMIAASLIVDIAFHAGRLGTVADDDAHHGPVGRLQTAVIDRVWRDLDEAIKGKLQSVILDDILNRAAAVGLRRPESTPMSVPVMKPIQKKPPTGNGVPLMA